MQVPMYAVSRKLRLISAALAIATLSSAMTFAWMRLRTSLRPEVPLTAGLHGNWASVSADFDNRVRNLFPVGTDEKSMGEALALQGFVRQDWESGSEVEHKAMRREDYFVCNLGAYVYWRVDRAGRISAIRGEYREEGCL